MADNEEIPAEEIENKEKAETNQDEHSEGQDEVAKADQDTEPAEYKTPVQNEETTEDGKQDGDVAEAVEDKKDDNAADIPDTQPGEEEKAGEVNDEGKTEEAAEEGEKTKDVDAEKLETTEGADAEASGEDKREGEDAETKDADESETPKEDGDEAIQENEDFEEGERPESPVRVGEKLSREGSPIAEEADETRDVSSPPVPGSPDNVFEDEKHALDNVMEEDEDDSAEEEEEEYQPEYDRDALIERYHAAIAEREQFQQQNYALQHKLAEYFRKKKGDESRPEVDKNVTDQEQRYLKYMSNLEELREQDADLRDNFKNQIEDSDERCKERQEKVDEERDKFLLFKKDVAFRSLNTRSGKCIPPKDIEAYLSTENKKESEVVNVRLENIKLKNKLKKKEMALKSKEELAVGLHLIDFEQLKIENQTYNEKIEERNEELLKLRKKITSTVQVLTHLKEKLQYVQGENGILKLNLHDVEATVAKKRDILTRTKQARDALRIDNQRLRQNCGLLGNEALLRDFEERVDEGESLRNKLDYLRKTHVELNQDLMKVRQKIEQAKQPDA